MSGGKRAFHLGTRAAYCGVGWRGATADDRCGGEALSGEELPAGHGNERSGVGKTLSHLRQVHQELVEAVEKFPSKSLNNQVPGKKGAHYNFYYMLQGVVQHELYHAGQIALLKKM